MARMYWLVFAILLLLELGAALPFHRRHTYKVHFFYLSKELRIKDWLEMFTLCLAPLVTHIAFGLADHVVLGPTGPKWTDKIAHFNPVSILWRYYAIAYRRVRAIHWDEADMAACNAVFWHGTGWDGSEALMVQSRNLITKLPASSHVAIVSGSSLATIAITLQGCQAMVIVLEAFVPLTVNLGRDLGGLPGIFQPLALMGLLRLQAALWLSNDYGYARIDHWQTPASAPADKLANDELLRSIAARLVCSRSWRAVSFRIWWALSTLALMGISIAACVNSTFSIFPQAGYSPSIIHKPASMITVSLMYLLLTAGCLVIHCRYLFKGCSGSTVIPCIQSRWYKGYTFLLFAAGAVSIIFSALGTQIQVNGTYSEFPNFKCNANGDDCHPFSAHIVLNISRLA